MISGASSKGKREKQIREGIFEGFTSAMLIVVLALAAPYCCCFVSRWYPDVGGNRSVVSKSSASRGLIHSKEKREKKQKRPNNRMNVVEQGALRLN